MPLSAGTRLGAYEIISAIGAGGMGEVYRARDTRLDRTVAIKVLTASLASDPDARARLKREARALSQLSHPHICSLYDVGEHASADYVVMELVDGETLAARLARGPLSIAQTSELGAQIADALERAHRSGIVHRDLKPANVMLTASGAKLLDFGLAKAVPPLAYAAADGTTLARSDATAAGTVLGTVQYMAPEQIEGRPADARSDIFALGQVLFEMATGRRAFGGNSAAAIAAAILATDAPALTSLQLGAPPALERIVSVCLEKSPDKRWQSAHDVAVLLRSLPSDGERRTAVGRSGGSLRWAPWALAAAASVVALAGWWRSAAPPSAPRLPAAFNVYPPPGNAFLNWVEANEMAVSPDGTKLAFIAATGGVWLRPIGSLTAAPVAGAERANAAFWSPDGRSLAFFGSGMLNRIDAGGGAAVPLCSVPTWLGHTGSWGADSIVFSPIGGQAIFRVPTSGGTAVELLKPDPARHEIRVLWPHFLPDGKRFLYVSWRDDRTARLMLWEPDGQPREIMSVFSNVEYVDPGYLLFVREGTLLARRFDAATATVRGDPVAVAQPVAYALIPGIAHFSSSRTGVLAYQSNSDLSRVAWFDSTGGEIERVLPSGRISNLRLSADGRQLLFERMTPGVGTFDLWMLDIERGVETRMTVDAGNEIRGMWTPDRGSLVYSAGPNGPPRVVIRNLATGAERPLRQGGGLQGPEHFTPDGRLLYVERQPGAGAFRLFVSPLSGAEATPLFEPRFTYGSARFSPDGTWLAYVSDEAGPPEVNIVRWPPSHGRMRVSTNGGSRPRWSRDGRELLFLSDAGLFSTRMTSAGPGKTSLVLARERIGRWSEFEIAPDGRFLAVVGESVAGEQPLTVVVNWMSRLP